MRSSLGLTLMHTAMFSGDSESTRWMMLRNPELLIVEDFQNDTPITVALKECAYTLLVFGQMNNGKLEDGTSYADEAYADYYPEIDAYREEVFDNGEFMRDLAIETILTAQDLITLKTKGFLEQLPQTEPKKKSPKKTAFKLDINGNIKLSQEEIAAEKAEKVEKKRLKRISDRAAREKVMMMDGHDFLSFF
jgi:hypothetical protein